MAKVLFYDAETNLYTGEAEGDLKVGDIVSNLAQAGIKRRKGKIGEGWVREGKSDELHVWLLEREPEPVNNFDITDIQPTTEETS